MITIRTMLVSDDDNEWANLKAKIITDNLSYTTDDATQTAVIESPAAWTTDGLTILNHVS